MIKVRYYTWTYYDMETVFCLQLSVDLKVTISILGCCDQVQPDHDHHRVHGERIVGHLPQSE